MKLREKWKKVKERQFADVFKVQAGDEIEVVAQTVFEVAGELLNTEASCPLLQYAKKPQESS
ncbi:hypothetical protein [Cohnella thermotolerans]|uniref:hypothetical protein n=1 Tax=Cohnella thermotolerans TaxID=329858 RepID=UPI0003F774C3|nr:hypothetical protein [Cohnella thermotolerans]